MARKTKEDALKTRHSILDAAEQVFYDHGVARTTMEHIATAAKVTRGAIYWHFKDKIQVFDAMMQRVFLPHEEVLERLSTSQREFPLEDLELAYSDAMRMMAKDKKRRRVISIMMFRCEYVEEMAPIMKRRRACKDRMLKQTLAMIEQAKKLDHLSPQWTPPMAALSLQALMGGLITAALEGRKAFDFAKTAPACLAMFFKALKKVEL